MSAQGAWSRWRSVFSALALLGVSACGPSDPSDAPAAVSADPAPGGPLVPVLPAPRVPAADSSGTLTWTGCDISKKAYMAEAVEAYEKATGIRIVVTGGGATRGIRATVGGQSDLGGACRQCLPDDFPDEEGGARLTHVAWDALVFFTHPKNTVDGLSSAQAMQILLGEIRDWRELGGEPNRILPAFRRQTVAGKLSGVGYMTRLMLFGDPTIDYTDEAIFHRSSGPIEEFVEGTPHSFAVTGVSSAARRDVKVLALDGVKPTKETISSGAYRLFRPLFLVTRGEPQGEALAFLDWITSPEGQEVLSLQGTVNLEEGMKLGAEYAHWPADPDLIRNR